jgi:hypothetical protein
MANPVRLLAVNLDLNCVDRGQRGELVVALLIMRTRDASYIHLLLIDDQSTEDGYTSPNLWKLASSSRVRDVEKFSPSHSRSDENKSFERTFNGNGVWFNHIIRIRNYDMRSL